MQVCLLILIFILSNISWTCIHSGSGEHVVIKCDLSECMLDPALLPMFEAHFVSLHTN